MASVACFSNCVAHRGPDHVDLHPGIGVEVVVVVRLKRRLNLLAAGIERSLVGFFGQADEHLVIRRRAEVLRAGVLQARGVNGLANRIDDRAAAKTCTSTCVPP